uniref:Uncharacterized protein n=1 Tax=Mustela putorius furo TaxID=9669 RepID=M3YIX8_MUSPF
MNDRVWYLYTQSWVWSPLSRGYEPSAGQRKARRRPALCVVGYPLLPTPPHLPSSRQGTCFPPHRTCSAPPHLLARSPPGTADRPRPSGRRGFHTPTALRVRAQNAPEQHPRGGEEAGGGWQGAQAGGWAVGGLHSPQRLREPRTTRSPAAPAPHRTPAAARAEPLVSNPRVSVATGDASPGRRGRGRAGGSAQARPCGLSAAGAADWGPGGARRPRPRETPGRGRRPRPRARTGGTRGAQWAEPGHGTTGYRRVCVGVHSNLALPHGVGALGEDA